MIDAVPSPEFLLAAACCRWPLSEQAAGAVRSAAKVEIDWSYFMRVVKRQRVAGLVHNALAASGFDLPPQFSSELAAQAQQIARQNLLLAAETIRLQRGFDTARIPVIVLKGVALAQLAYGSLALKHSKDIDLLVPPDRAVEALQQLERDGYTLWQPAAHLSEAQRRATVQYGAEFALVQGRDGRQVELRWRLPDNPRLLTGVDACSETRDVSLAGGASVRTLNEEDLFAYLCVHGAGHAWSRLKWLADLNALIAHKSEADIEHLYRHAQARGCGLCSALALLLCHQLLELPLPSRLTEEFRNRTRLKKSVAIAMDMMIGPDAGIEMEDRPFGSTRVALLQFLLGEGWPYFFTQCRVFCVRLGDVISLPLPRSLHFLYPILRLPLWLWRRGRYLGRSGARRAPRQR